jgi:V/A-type H+-transporting ATPase subunit E
MALASVTQEINAAAAAKAKAIMDEANAEIARINADADAKIAEMKDREDKKLKEAVERLNRQELSSAELESKKIVLAKKKEILADAFETTLAGLVNAPSDVKLVQYKAMVKAVADVIPNPKARMSVNDSFTAEDLGVGSVEKDSRIVAGLILQSEDGLVEVDMQYSTLLQTIWDSEIKAVSDILFR